jgi:ubiquinone/menaquinone biosynthesis C-methylase UbiE
MTTAGMQPSWADVSVASAYDRYVEGHDLYSRTSARLVAMAATQQTSHVLDLCCGTGATAAAVLLAVPQCQQLLCLDSSAAMLAVARSKLADPRIVWLHMAAEQLDQLQHLDLAGVDICVCNMAMWTLNVQGVLDGLRRILRPSGLLAFNVGWWVADASHSAEKARFVDLEEDWRGRLAQAGYQVKAANWRDYGQSRDSINAWIAVPVFARLADVLTQTDRQVAADGPTVSPVVARVLDVLASPL